VETEMEQFPATNPNPVLSVAKDGTVLYSNVAGEPLLNEWGVTVGEKLPSIIGFFVQRVISENNPKKMEVKAGKRVYLVTFHPLPEEDCVSVYGFDISDQKKFEKKLIIKEKQNDILYKIGKIALEYESLQSFMDESVKLIASILEQEYCKIMELMPDGKFLLKAGTGWKPEFVGKNVVEGGKGSLAGYTLFSRMPVIVDDFKEEYRFEKPEILKIHGVVSGASVVIGSMKKIYGALIVNSTKKRMFTSDDIYFLNSVAFLIAQVVERKKTEEALKKAHDNLEEKVKERTTQLEKTYNSLKESEGRLAEAQKMAHIGNWVWDIATDKEYWSNELYRIFKRDPQEAAPSYKEYLNYVHPDDRDYVDNAFKGTINGKPYEIDHRIILVNREERTVHIQAEVVFNDKNIPIQTKGIVQDITERKKSEEKIQTLANIVESSNDAIGTISLEGIITSWNKGAEQVYGYSAEEVIGKTVSILAPSHLDEETKKLSEMIIKGEKVHRYETLRLRKDGKIIDVSINLSPVFDASRKLTAVSFIVRDITERKRAEEKLRESEEKYRNIVETANEGILITDNEAIITYVNKKMVDMLGYTLKEGIGRPIWGFISEEYKPIVKLNLEKRLQGLSESYELKLMRKDGSPLWVLINAKPLFDKDGKYMGVMSMFTDITKRKEAEEALTNIEIARKKEIHHRIKNNLQVISSLLDLEAEKFKGRKDIIDSEVTEAFRESQDRVISMALIHEELHEGVGDNTLNFSLYLEKLVDNLFQTYRLGNVDISLNMDVENNTLFDMDTAVPLGIIVNELVSNSLKHAFPGRNKGEIRIKLPKEEKESDESTRFTLNVSDNGVGIPENIDIRNTDTLGLQLVTTLVDQLDGELELKSKNGAEFTIRFTVKEKSEQVSEPALQ
jgi:PAS domain S-box-containing protein